jgi:fructose-1,6-bisphosphatase/inositol monophosphatase family enzyme
MDKHHLQLFLDRMSLAIRQAGGITKILQGKVANEGKEAETLPHDEQYQIAKRSAKTPVDEIVQEVLLLAALEIVDRGNIILDAEEISPSTRLFSSHQSTSLSLVIDPIDGTLEYVSGRDDYSICVGLIEQARMISALVYFPSRDHLYFLGIDGCGYLARDAYMYGLQHARALVGSTTSSSLTIYKNNRVPSDVLTRLATAGYEVRDEDQDELGCPDALLKCLTGEAKAYIGYTKNMRDILLGAIIGGAQGGYARDWSGQTLAWPMSGRVPHTLFGIDPLPDTLQRCLTPLQVMPEQ